MLQVLKAKFDLRFKTLWDSDRRSQARPWGFLSNALQQQDWPPSLLVHHPNAGVLKKERKRGRGREREEGGGVLVIVVESYGDNKMLIMRTAQDPERRSSSHASECQAFQ